MEVSIVQTAFHLDYYRSTYVVLSNSGSHTSNIPSQFTPTHSAGAIAGRRSSINIMHHTEHLEGTGSGRRRQRCGDVRL